MSKPSRVRALFRGLWRGLSRPRPSGWTRAQAIGVDVVHAMLTELGPLPAAQQREWLEPPKLSPPPGRSRRAEVIAGRPAYRYLCDDPNARGLIVHFHGGGYVTGGVEVHDPYLYALAERAGVPVLSVDYRLAPEHPYPAALDDGVAVVRALISAGYRPSELILCGDSAGAALVLSILVALRDQDDDPVAGAILGSPCLELADIPESPSFTDGGRDMIPASIVEIWAKAYAGESSRSLPALSPGRADLSKLPPLQILCGEYETLRPTILAGAQRAREAGVEVELIEGHQAVHCWYMFLGKMPSVDDALDRIVGFARRRLGLADAPTSLASVA